MASALKRKAINDNNQLAASVGERQFYQHHGAAQMGDGIAFENLQLEKKQKVVVKAEMTVITLWRSAVENNKSISINQPTTDTVRATAVAMASLNRRFLATINQWRH